ncbi:MAG: methylisocitrate lyase [Alphaproteobacteria bacterium]|nr:methylisocitrate lyase [Alphaproteobacteria bacterium]
MLNPPDPAIARRALKDGLAAGRGFRFVGAFSPLVARLVEEIGFEGVYVGSSTMSADLALPDIGLISLSEATGRGREIVRATALPCLLDADTGYGEAVNVARSVVELEAAGLAAMQIEDQVNPKRCGHLDNKQVIETRAMAEKLRAAVAARRDANFLIVARTDARGVEGLQAAIARGNAYRDAGADAVFPDALQDEAEFAAFRRGVAGPLVANMTEFGRSRLLDHATLVRLGYQIVLYPVTTLRLAMRAVEDGLRALHQAGTQSGLLDRMQTRARLYELIRYEAYGRFDKAVADFTLPPERLG